MPLPIMVRVSACSITSPLRRLPRAPSFNLDRVLIVDFDVHHGNGTNSIFYRDPSVLFFSTHQWGIYPGTGYWDEVGEGDGCGL